MADIDDAIGVQLRRQIQHWVAASERMDLDTLASPAAWAHLESYLGVSLRRHLDAVIARLTAEARRLAALEADASSSAERGALRRRLMAFQTLYLRAERTLEFFADAIGCRTNPQVAALLRACDTLVQRCMAAALEPLGRIAPPALTYLGEGRGASILRAHQRLWDGGELCPVAAIKITRHNLLRPTALLHESGHQVAAMLGWNDALAEAIATRLQAAGAGPELVSLWSGWSSEIAADAFAFVHAGYASVAALHDVVDGDSASAFRLIPGAPHPIADLRVRLGVEMCRRSFGKGPWDALQDAWIATHDRRHAAAEAGAIVEASLPLVPLVAEVAIEAPLRAFGGRSLRDLVDPARVSPAALEALHQRVGDALFTSAHWLWTEPLRILGLTGLRLATRPLETRPALELQRTSMLRIGGAAASA